MKHSVMPEQGLVPDSATAIKIALAVWEPIYGAERLARQRPYRASLQDGVWYVAGTLPVNRLGGTAEAEISQTNGAVLRVSHGR